LTDALGAVVFLDAGQVSLSSFTFPVGDLQLGVGAGLRYRTPIGPLRVDLGFPLDRRRGDPAFQVQFSIGPGF
jgi:translocation and assembly module TamA